MVNLLVTAAEMAAIDRYAIDTLGIPGVCLMENAGAAVVRAMSKRYGRMAGRSVGILAGKGNNGGDGYVIARHLHNLGARVEVTLLFDPDSVQGDARTHFDIIRKLPIPVHTLLDEAGVRQAALRWSEFDFWVDGVFGTGLSSAPQGHVATALGALSEGKAPVVAVDIPSGLDADTGHPLGEAIRADLTVTFGHPKRGHIVQPGPQWTGELVVADIGIPPAVSASQGIRTYLLEEADVSPLLPPHPPDAHKGTFGHILVVAGSTGKMGAAFLAAEAALRGGAGLVTLAYPGGAESFGRVPPEVMTIPLPSTPQGTFAMDALTPGLEAASSRDAVVLGPGLTTQGETVSFVRQWVAKCPKPLVLDADGLNALAVGFDGWKDTPAPLCLTPHPGEFSRLLNITSREVQADRIEKSRAFATCHGVHLALKGAGTVLADPGGGVWVNTTGNPGLGTAGTGDVLAGLVGALLARGLPPGEALRAAVYLHGLAGDLAVQDIGESGLLATDVIAHLPAARRRVLSDRSRRPNPGGAR